MKCDETQELLGSLFDGELPAEEVRLITHHVDRCPNCQAVLEDLEHMRQQIRASANLKVPITLEGRVRRAISSEPDATPGFQLLIWRWLRPVVTHLTAAILGGAAIYALLQTPSPPARSASAFAMAHVHALQSDRVVEIEDRDPHSVAPWFAGKIDYAPKVFDLGAAGFPLLGGRTDQIGDRTVATLAYSRRKHIISVFVEPAAPGAPAAILTEVFRGFHIHRWQTSGFVFWAVSDLNVGEIADLRSLLTAAMARSVASGRDAHPLPR